MLSSPPAFGGVWTAQSSPSSSHGSSHSTGRTLIPSSHHPHSYHITKVPGEIVVLFREWILKLLAEVSVGDKEGERVHVQTQLGL